MHRITRILRGAGRGITTPQQTLPSDSLHLTRTEKRELIDFLGALTDNTGITRSRP